MGRKKGGKNADTDLKDLKTLEKVINGGKTRAEAAKELGIHPESVSRRIHRVINNENIQAMIQRSIDRNAMMLGKCDNILNKILDSSDPMHMGHQLKATEGVYKSFGVWKSEPVVQLNNFTPITIKTHEGIDTVSVGTPSKAI